MSDSPLHVTPSERPPGRESPGSLRYLVTGGGGFIGRHLIGRLEAIGAQVHATTRAQPPSTPSVGWWRVDLADPAATQRLVHQVRPDVLVHLASRAEGTRALDVVVPMLYDNLLSTVNIMTAATAVAGCRVVLAGSVEEAGAAPDGVGPHSPYAASKVAATTYAALFRDLWRLPVVVLRLAHVYGPAEPNTHRLLPYVINSLLDEVAPALSGGTRRIDWVYIDDVVDALVAAAVEPGALGKVIDIGSGTLVSIREIVSMVAAAIGADVEPGFGRQPDRARERDLVADPGLAHRALGWRPRIGLRTGIERTVAWHLALRAAESGPRSPFPERGATPHAPFPLARSHSSG
ncbi:NAD-dependent epimerase/dehydratase family protein [Pseudonocardia hispaniensis]|uniref:NAD-dependent epimerase/dehydratase family protein n=1 Tax=Pseudonocardia hispaniensis TaxID=904933 RepID=A0ABW1IY53_9PSEU